ncbi:hypothetical protein BEWA_030440 [Theileria equi strain WA]|uniref:Lon N-terminal domain-containing protein n=1 Tax=Theileria equi strain WA TaxID=1537102 RepID=L0AYU1_THEEQ|nr:hypothetical protein BEWA_030440 [Theileria equi strain WA]AFZ80191.1 hypothetical protein BEWA_030440 [Theileria equi strain WA]|eukprot:XP_004829857.1 hypothetical protein BEWA_030440 [Theileria equi strain WA]
MVTGRRKSALYADDKGGDTIKPSGGYEEGVDYKETMEEEERESMDYIDRMAFDVPDSTQDESNQSTDGYFDWKGIADDSTPEKESVSEKGIEISAVPDASQDDVIKTANVDGKKVNDVEVGNRPIKSGSGMDMDFQVEDYELGVTNGRLNEWPLEWVPGEKVCGFFPILIDEYSLNPSPLQIGFEEPIRFRGKHVESTFNSIVDKVGDKEVFGMCFLNPNSGQLAPLAVYAELLSKKTIVDGGGESLEVVGRVLGRVLINKILLEEPFIKAKICPMEDKPGLENPDNIPKIVDEITNLYGLCNELEAQIMELIEQPYAVIRINNRKPLFNIIDERLGKFMVDPKAVNQGFAQIAAYAAFDHHLSACERYDALVMQNSEDRLRFVRDHLKIKIRQLTILKNAPRDRLEDLVKHFRDIRYSEESARDAGKAIADKYSVDLGLDQ